MARGQALTRILQKELFQSDGVGFNPKKSFDQPRKLQVEHRSVLPPTTDRLLCAQARQLEDLH